MYITDTTVQRACIMRRELGHHLHKRSNPRLIRQGIRTLKHMIEGLTPEQREEYSQYIEATR